MSYSLRSLLPGVRGIYEGCTKNACCSIRDALILSEQESLCYEGIGNCLFLKSPATVASLCYRSKHQPFQLMSHSLLLVLEPVDSILSFSSYSQNTLRK